MSRQLVIGQYATSSKITMRLNLLPSEQVDKSAKFKRWLALFFIGKGHYKITDKGYTELAPNTIRQGLEFGEPVSDRKREPRMEDKRPLTRNERREAVSLKIESALEEGKVEELYDKGHIDRPKRLNWKDKTVRIASIVGLIRIIEKDPREIIHDDFKNNGLSGLIDSYNDSPYAALAEAGYMYSTEEILQHSKTGSFQVDKIYSWELFRVSNELYKDVNIRIGAIKWLIWKTQKLPKDIIAEDFENNGVGGLLTNHYHSSSYTALVEAGYSYSIEEVLEQAKTSNFNTDKFYPWEMMSSPQSFYKEKSNRVAVTKWLIWKTEKNPKEITTEDFENNGLGGLLGLKYNSSPYLALVDAGYAHAIEELIEHAKVGNFEDKKIYPWEMNNVRVYNDKAVCIAATKWLLWKTGKTAREITIQDFDDCGLIGFFSQHYGGSPYAAIVDAGYAYSIEEVLEQAKTSNFNTDKFYPWEMNSVRIYEDKAVCIAATKWLLWKTGKTAREIVLDDFSTNKMGGLSNYYNGSPFAALVDAGYAYSIDELLEHAKVGNFEDKKIYPWELSTTPHIYENIENRKAATRWIRWKIRKEAKTISATDFQNNGLGALIGKYYNNSPFTALLEAGLVTVEDKE